MQLLNRALFKHLLGKHLGYGAVLWTRTVYNEVLAYSRWQPSVLDGL